MTFKTMMMAAALAALGTTGAMAQDTSKMATGDKMASHEAITTDHMAAGHMAGHKKMSKAQMKKHDAMMKHDAMKTDAMKSSTPQ